MSERLEENLFWTPIYERWLHNFEIKESGKTEHSRRRRSLRRIIRNENPNEFSMKSKWTYFCISFAMIKSNSRFSDQQLDQLEADFRTYFEIVSQTFFKLNFSISKPNELS